jgi:hypothetical protein
LGFSVRSFFLVAEETNDGRSGMLDAAAVKARHGLSLRCEANRAETLALDD